MLTGGTSSQEAALAAAEGRVPKKVALGEGSQLVIRSVRREWRGRAAACDRRCRRATGAGTDLFAEGPTPAWALPLPAAIAGAPAGLQRFVFALDGAPPGAKLAGAQLTLTAVAAAQAIEVATRLD